MNENQILLCGVACIAAFVFGVRYAEKRAAQQAQAAALNPLAGAESGDFASWIRGNTWGNA